jgi:hypothetical protein
MLAEKNPPFYLPTDERRQATRFDKEPGTESVTLRTSTGKEIVAEVQNESLGGMAVLLAQANELTVGTELRISYAGDSLRAIVRHRESLPDGRIRLGLDCRGEDHDSRHNTPQ